MTKRRKLRSEMTEEERERVRAQARFAHKMKQRGTPMKVTPEEFERARALLDKARRHGMDDRMIAAQIGLTGDTTIWKIRTGAYRSMYRDTYVKVLQLRPESTVSRVHPTKGKVPDGAPVHPAGTVRRLQALRADGFTLTVIARLLGVSPSAVSDLHRRPRGAVYHTTYREVKAVYDKLSGTRPEDHGIPQPQITYARNWARKKGWAPSHCWDDDTIDRPDAFPEWTGACGTPFGYKVHYRREIPLCEVCRAARMEARAMENPGRGGKRGIVLDFNGNALKEARVKAGISHYRLAIDTGIAEASISQWENKGRKPTYDALVQVAEALDMTVEDFRDTREEICGS